MQDTSKNALNLLEKIFQEQVSFLSSQDLHLLSQHSSICSQYALEKLIQETTHLESKSPWNPSNLHWGLRFCAFYENCDAFPSFCLLHNHVQEIRKKLGVHFISSHWLSFLHCVTPPLLGKLQEEIERTELDEEIRSAFLESLSLLVVRGKLSRREVVEYFQDLYSRILDQEITNPFFISNLVDATINFWPGELLENIRELFGLKLVDENHTSLYFAIEAFEIGEEEIRNDTLQWMEDSAPLRLLLVEDSKELEHYRQSLTTEHLPSEEFTYLGLAPQKIVEFSLIQDKKKRPIELHTISEGYLPDPTLDAIPLDDKRLYIQIQSYFLHKPHRALDTAYQLLQKHPQVPALYMQLHSIYNYLNMIHPSMRVLKEMKEKFPDYLPMQIEYCQYLLRRGEAEKMGDFLSHRFTLTRLHPDKQQFPVEFWVRFTHTVGWYFTQIGVLDPAYQCLNTLKEVAPTRYECEDLARKIEEYALAESEPLDI